MTKEKICALVSLRQERTLVFEVKAKRFSRKAGEPLTRLSAGGGVRL